MLPHVCTRTRLHTYMHRPPESGTHGNLHCVAWCTSYTDPHPCPWSVNRPSIPCIHTQQQDKQKGCMHHTTAITTELHFTLQTCIKHHPEYIHTVTSVHHTYCVSYQNVVTQVEWMGYILFNTTTTQCKLLYAQVVQGKRPPAQVAEGNHHLQSSSSSPAATCAGGVFPRSTSAFTNVCTNE